MTLSTIHVKIFHSKLIPTIHEYLKPLFPVKYNTNRNGDMCTCVLLKLSNAYAKVLLEILQNS